MVVKLSGKDKLLTHGNSDGICSDELYTWIPGTERSNPQAWKKADNFG
jgi:hypothetical protein